MKKTTILLMIQVFFLIGCNPKGNNEVVEISDTNQRIFERVEKNKERIISTTFDLIPYKEDWSENTVVLVYNSSDCNSCIFEAVHILENLYSDVPGSEIFYYNVYEGLDRDNFLQLFDNNKFSNLKTHHYLNSRWQGVMTPVIINLTKESLVKRSYFPLTGISQTQDSINFINSYKH